MAHMYILRCGDGSFYVGSTRDLDRRLAEHASGNGAAYTRRRLPVELVYRQQFDRIDDAYVVEKQVQGWSRGKRMALIAGRFDLLPELARKRV
ncbi:GIY-YIG nuclease family protein [Agromyces sp. Leaf222]|uniref:GIY-YIG nuclease family protein n=1 Tax=Agromyces sp. Leaf222 TaxID=1735688 RepID=UPI0006FE7D15|nr:GIY-YIG nuclease family protein [Agromyces sp. Leaf222]KQM82152.1 excinuclease ABC subunit C [Agromyces sp. Leaf222]